MTSRARSARPRSPPWRRDGRWDSRKAAGAGRSGAWSGDVFYWIYDYPSLIMGPLFAAGFVLLALIGQFVFRALLAKWVHTESRTNELVGISLASFAVLYGILLALLAVGAYTNYASMDDLVSKEASCVASLYRDASAFPEPYRDSLQRDLKAYVRQTVD